jgi:HK97 family phage portal protein
MLVSKAAQESVKKVDVKVDNDTTPRGEFISSYGEQTVANERVSVERSKTLDTFYRAANTIIDDVAMMPFQQFERIGETIQQVYPDEKLYNIPYLMQITPNPWGWTPFQFKQVKMQWKLFHGNSYVWRPPVWPPQLLILPADKTKPVIEASTGDLWYQVQFTNGKYDYIPAVEILHELINPDASGLIGRGVVTYARETLGRQLGAHKTQSKFYSQGLNPSGVLYLADNIKTDDVEEREKLRRMFTEKISGSDGAYNIAVADKRIRDFKPVSLSPKDAMFLESMDADDRAIANFFKMPLHMMNMGKEAYNSNEQKFGEYLQQTLDPHLIPMEQGARIRWLAHDKQATNYFKFNRGSILRMNAKERAEVNEIKIRSGQMNANEARALDEQNAYAEGNDFYMSTNYMKITGVKPNEDPE